MASRWMNRSAMHHPATSNIRQRDREGGDDDDGDGRGVDSE